MKAAYDHKLHDARSQYQAKRDEMKSLLTQKEKEIEEANHELENMKSQYTTEMDDMKREVQTL